MYLKIIQQRLFTENKRKKGIFYGAKVDIRCIKCGDVLSKVQNHLFNANETINTNCDNCRQSVRITKNEFDFCCEFDF